MNPKNLADEINILISNVRILPIFGDLELKLYAQFNFEIQRKFIRLIYSIQHDITDK